MSGGNALRGALCLILQSFALGGCGMASGPEFCPVQAEPGKATVYVYRPWRLTNYKIIWTLIINGRPVAVTEAKGYYACTVEPGMVRFHATRKTDPSKMFLDQDASKPLEGVRHLTTVEAKPGEVYYFKLGMNEWTLPYPTPQLEQVSVATGQDEIKHLRRMKLINTP